MYSGTSMQIKFVIHDRIWWVGDRGGWEEKGSECQSPFFSITKQIKFSGPVCPE